MDGWDLTTSKNELAGRRVHWNDVYLAKSEAEVSWFEKTPAVSIYLLHLVGARSEDAIIDIGGGASRLVDHLLELGFRDVTVLDLSETALATARVRLGARASNVGWITADVTRWAPDRTYDIWHDRAALHFLIDPADQAAYVARLDMALRIGGRAIIGTFAPDGPEKCSGLPVRRYDADSLAALLGSGYVLIDSRRIEHATPGGAIQKFQFATFRRER